MPTLSYNGGMLELARTVRFCLNADGPADAAAAPKDNTFAAWPAMRGLGRYYELDVRCAGEADPTTGYFMNIKRIDAAVRDHVLPELQQLILGPTPATQLPMGWLMQRMMTLLQPPLDDSAIAVTLRLTPMYRLTIERAAMDSVTIRQQYEFSAAHRLHVASLSEQENHAVFGKCNNPAGHGHNYRLEVAVNVPIDPSGDILPVERLDATVNHHAIEALDHKHLNKDVPQFAEMNPSVEHIAQVLWQMLEVPIHQLDATGQITLVEVSVWETEKTVCTYRGPQQGEASEAGAGSKIRGQASI
jgi:6-pyruvoyltetrahydropterin/6-carboxytetrahydropterin synthase